MTAVTSLKTWEKSEREGVSYSIHAHKPSGEVYALRWQHFAITGVCGPLALDERDAPLTDYEYDSDDAQWANSQQWQ